MNTEKYELTASAGKVQLYSIIVAMFAFLVLTWPFKLIFGRNMVSFGDITAMQWVICGVTFFLGIAVHELIHGLTAIWYGNIKLSDAKFGIQWKTLTPYFHSKAAIIAKRYRIVAVMPLIIMGIIPYIIALIIGNGWLLAFGILFILTAGGDILILWMMRNVLPDEYVMDHPEKIGLIVLNENEI
jgi:hypothetical protein